jgi:ribosomal protein L16 Arg81 hydroxylase
MKRNLSYNNAPTISTSRSDIKRTKEKAQRIREMLNDPIFQETDFERMFVESVKAVKDRKLLKK